MYEKCNTDQLTIIESRHQKLQKQLENSPNTNLSIQQRQLENSCKLSITFTNLFTDELTGKSLGKQLADILNKDDGIYKTPENIKNSTFADLTNISKEIFNHLPNPITGFSTKSILPTLSSITPLNVIIPHPVDNPILPLIPEELRTLSSQPTPIVLPKLFILWVDLLATPAKLWLLDSPF
ncbi:hypothetical protein C6497_01015 [Candidatus Poribacteria bacterium]|nr:MAG: hypothetical protein C6497_01015 [Candidatus Poribacteria bacterium]